MSYFLPFSISCGVFVNDCVFSVAAAPVGQANMVQALWDHRPPCLSCSGWGLPSDANLMVDSSSALWLPRESITCVTNSQH